MTDPAYPLLSAKRDLNEAKGWLQDVIDPWDEDEDGTARTHTLTNNPDLQALYDKVQAMIDTIDALWTPRLQAEIAEEQEAYYREQEDYEY